MIFLQRHISYDPWSLGPRGEELWSPGWGAYPFKVYVFEVESVDVAREEAVWSSRISPKHTSQRKGRKKVSKRLGGKRGLPKEREADVDEEVGTAAGNEEDTKGRDCGDGIKSALIDCQIRGWESRERERERERALTEDGDYYDEDG